MLRMLFAAVMLALVMLGAAAMGAPICGPRAEVLKQLAEKYEEAPVGIGISAAGAIIELSVSASGTWTLLATTPKGPTCLIGSGEAWQAVEPKTRPDERGS